MVLFFKLIESLLWFLIKKILLIWSFFINIIPFKSNLIYILLNSIDDIDIVEYATYMHAKTSLIRSYVYDSLK